MNSKSKLCRYTLTAVLAVACVWILFLASCQEAKKAEPVISEEVAYLRGIESWVYGYPLVLMDVTRQVLTAVPAPNADGTAAPINQFARMPHYVDPQFKNVVRISLNSLWTTGFLDLDKEPIILSVPDTHGRYYVMSMMNMWTNVFGSVGKRTTGTGPGAFLIVGPKWQGTAPAGIKATFRCSTRYAWVLGQTQANGPKDFAAVNAIQAKYQLIPLSAWGKPYQPSSYVPVDTSVAVSKTPDQQVAAMDADIFFNRLAMLMKDNPPDAEDESALSKLKDIGVEPGKPFNINNVNSAIAGGLTKALKEVPAKMKERVTKMKTVNGWMNPTNLGHYGTDYDTRAGIAWVGLGANQKEDSIYPTAYVDGDGNTLDSANKYVMHYDNGTFQPTNATWSISQYRGNFYESNVLNKYVIGLWQELKFNPDGSIDFYLQADSPGKDKEANWLPTPSGVFNITIRNYWPKPEAWDGTYKNPPIKKLQ
jgi:hypothetical protein